MPNSPRSYHRLSLGFITATAIGFASLTSLQAAELRIGNPGEPDTLDPHHSTTVYESRILRQMFLGLVAQDAAGKAIPGAAESWTVSDDGLIYTFTLRDHTWSDGTPVTAGDFEFAFRRLLAPETAAQYASILYTIKNAKHLNEATMDDMTNLGVKAVDDKTLEVTLEYPAPYFIEQLTHVTGYPVPKHKIEEVGEDWIKAGNLVSNGSYVFTEWVPNDHVTVVKNDAFYDADSVAIDQITFYPTEERNAGTKRYRAGELDIQYDFASEQIEWLNDNLPDETRVSPWLNTYYYTFNLEKPPFDNQAVREALAMAIDREAIVEKVLRTGEVPAYAMVPPGAGGYDQPGEVSWKDMDYDDRLAKAKELLDEAGYGPGNPLKFQLRYNTSEQHKKVAIAIAAMWKELGVQPELFNSEVKVHYNDLQEGNYEVARAGWAADFNDPQNFLFLMEGDTGPLNYARYDNADFNGLMNQSDVTTDPAERIKLMREAELIAMGQMPVIPIFYGVSKNLVSPRVQGYEDNVANVHPARFLSLAE